MTDALRPVGRSRPGRALPDLPDLPSPDVRPAVRAVGARVGAEVKRPYHLGVLLGLSAGAYAASLAGVTFLQASSEAATVAVRAPAMEAVDEMAAANDRLEQTLIALRDRLIAAGDDYGVAAASLAALQTQLETFSTTVGAIEGQSLRLPTRISLPGVPRARSSTISTVVVVTKPRTVATTGASGK
jgi:hypothetical protein